MNSRKKILKKLFTASLSLALLSAVYVHVGILPGKARLYAIQKIEEISGKKVDFDKAIYMPFHGFIFYNLHVREKNGAPLFSAARYALDVKILPFLKDKKIVISAIYLDAPVYDLVLEPHKKIAPKKTAKTEISGQIDVPAVSDAQKMSLEDVAGGPDMFLPENVYIEEIRITDGYLTIRQNEGSPLLETVKEINVRMAFRKPPLLFFDGSVKLGDKTYASIDLDGLWDLKNASYAFNLITDWDKIPVWLKNYQKDHSLALEEGRLKLFTELKSVGEAKVLFHTKADLRDAQARIQKGRYEGHLQVDVKGLFNFDAKRVERYKGTLELVDVNFLDLSPKIARIDHVQGRVAFRPDLLTIETLRGQYKEVPFNARGTITSFKDLILNGEIHTSVDLEKILSLVPAEQKKLLKDFDIEGGCEALTTLRGSLKNTSELSAEYKMALRNASLLSHDGKVSLNNLSCDLFSGKEGLTVSGARFIFDKKNYSADLFVPKNPAAAGSLRLTTDGLSLKTNYFLKEGAVEIENASAALPGIEAHFKGHLYPQKKPLLDIHGSAVVNLARVVGTYAVQNPWLKEVSPSGLLNGAFSYRGAWNDLPHAQIALNAKSTTLHLGQKILLENLTLDAGMTDGILTLHHFNAEAYAGMCGLKGNFNFMSPGIPFSANFYLNNLNLNQLAAGLGLENKKLAGNLMLQSSLTGFLKDQETYRGHGAFSVKNGFLWETSQFKAMGNLPLVKMEGLDWVTFREAGASYEIHNKKLWTENLVLNSDTVHLDLHGSLSFNQDLDMLMDIAYTNAVFLGAEDAGGLVPLMVNQAAGLISQYRISGSLKKPKYDKVIMPQVDTVRKKIGGLLSSLTS